MSVALPKCFLVYFILEEHYCFVSNACFSSYTHTEFYSFEFSLFISKGKQDSHWIGGSFWVLSHIAKPCFHFTHCWYKSFENRLERYGITFRHIWLTLTGPNCVSAPLFLVEGGGEVRRNFFLCNPTAELPGCVRLSSDSVRTYITRVYPNVSGLSHNEIYAYNTRWEGTQRVMAANLTRLTHKIAIQLHLVAESCTICSSRSMRPVRRLLDTLPYYGL
jgi:hypothetical protein